MYILYVCAFPLFITSSIHRTLPPVMPFSILHNTCIVSVCIATTSPLFVLRTCLPHRSSYYWLAMLHTVHKWCPSQCLIEGKRWTSGLPARLRSSFASLGIQYIGDNGVNVFQFVSLLVRICRSYSLSQRDVACPHVVHGVLLNL